MLQKFKNLYFELVKPMPLGNNFDNYDEYWVKRGFHGPSLKRSEIMSKYIDSDATILDIGCGDGTTIEYLNTHCKPKEIIGIDISKEAVEHVRKRGYEAHVIGVPSMEFEQFLKNKKFDYIIISEVLEHIQDAEDVIMQVSKNCNKNLMITVPNVGFFPFRLRLMLGKFPVVIIQEHIKEHIRFWTVNDFKYWAKYHGYKVENVIPTAGLHYKPLEFLEKFSPSFFGQQILYRLSTVPINKEAIIEREISL